MQTEFVAHGALASVWAATFAGAGTPMLFADPTAAIAAQSDAVDRRERGERFVAALAMDYPRLAVALAVAATMVANGMAPGKRRSALELITAGELVVNNARIDGLQPYGNDRLAALRDVLFLADSWIARSHAEGRRVATMTSFAKPPTIAIDPGPPLELARTTRDGGIVVYAPHEPPERLALMAAALDDLHLPVTVVASRAHAYPLLRTRVVGPADAAAVVARAQAVMDGDGVDPTPILALRECGAPIAVPTTNGASEYLPEAVTFCPWERESITTAALGILGRAGMRKRTIHATQPLPPAPAAPVDGPLATIVVTTYNRRDLLPKALASAERQTYRNLEIVVVDDAGSEPVDDIVARFPRARLIRNETNLRLPGSRNVALATTSGTYVTFLDDDDVLFPDHVAELVAALERSGAAAANSDSVSRFIKRAPDGGYRTRGYKVEIANAFDPIAILWRNASPVMTMMLRRDVLARAGAFDASLAVCLEDYDLWVRLTRTIDIVHVDRITAVYTKREDGSSMIAATGEQHGSVIDAIYRRTPAGDDEVTVQRRERVVASLRAAGHPPVSQPHVVIDAPYPL
jgi:GT2 family glycosyltransferase